LTFCQALLLTNIRFIAFDKVETFNGVEIATMRVVDMDHLRHSKRAEITLTYDELMSRQWYICHEPKPAPGDFLGSWVREILANDEIKRQARKAEIEDAHRRQREPKKRPQKKEAA